MPSRLIGRRRISSRDIPDLAPLEKVQVERFGTPWGGYNPDLDDQLTNLSDLKDCQGLVMKTGVLGPHEGFAALVGDGTQYSGGAAADSNLPFAVGNITDVSVHAATPTVTTEYDHGLATGDTVTLINTDSTPVVDGTYVITRTGRLTFTIPFGATTVLGSNGQWNGGPTGNGGTKNVLGLFEYKSGAALDTVQIATVGTSVIPAGNESGHLYKYTGSPLFWDEVPYNPAASTNAEGIRGEDRDHFDFAYFPPDDVVVFCNNLRVAYEFGNGASYQEWVHNLGGVFPGNSSFTAKSVESVDDRLLFLNTTEAAAAFLRRVRWTTKGADADLTGVGNGEIDLNEIPGEGLRIERIGDLIACYFTDGIALLRRTFLATSAFERFYVSHDRGVLSTFSVVNLGGGFHFLIGTDGWYVMDQTGNFRELGLRRVGQTTYSKWRDTFYGSLDTNNLNRIYCQRHGAEDTNLIKIAWPDNSADDGLPNRIWIYDLQTDTVWPDNSYPGTTGPNVFSLWGDVTAGTQWDQMGTETWEGVPGAWRDFGSTIGRERIVHGTIRGEVHRHTSALFTKNGVNQSYRALSHEADLGLVGAVKVGDKLRLEYTRTQQVNGADPLAVNAFIQAEEDGRAGGGQIDQLDGIVGTRQNNYVTTRLPSSRLGWRTVGPHPIFLHGGELHYFIEGDENVEAEQ
jgi:hypothetical protein